jgi:hypothetical protein
VDLKSWRRAEGSRRSHPTVRFNDDLLTWPAPPTISFRRAVARHDRGRSFFERVLAGAIVSLFRRLLDLLACLFDPGANIINGIVDRTPARSPILRRHGSPRWQTSKLLTRKSLSPLQNRTFDNGISSTWHRALTRRTSLRPSSLARSFANHTTLLISTSSYSA